MFKSQIINTNTNIWQKFRAFWLTDFSLEIFKIHRLVWSFLWIFGYLNLFHQFFCLKVLLIVNVTKTTFRGIFYHRIITTWQLSLGSTNENISKFKQRTEPRVNMDKSKTVKQKNPLPNKSIG
jgi:hypothetical protein